MKKALHLIIACLLLVFPLVVSATEYTINSADEFNNLNLSAGDVVTWQNGTYSSDERIKFFGSGTASNPITLKAETPGGVIFTGGLAMDIAGNYLVVDGFYWNGGYGASNFIQFRSGTTYAQNCTIQNCAINALGVNPDDVELGTSVKHRWIVLYGNYNNVLNCSFMNKSTAGALVLVELEYNAEVNRCAEVGHTISNNYFYNYEKIDPSLTNAGDSETIRVGTSEFQNVDCRTTVSNNYFVSADGENEIITNKSDNNIYENNTFRRCRGSLVLRHGSGATVQGNYFLGENVDGTGGIRIVDSDHTITNNYIQDCITVLDQTKWNNGITFMGGGDNSVDNCSTTSVSNGYQESEDIVVSNNTIVNTNAPLFFNGDKGTSANTGNVSNNVIFFESGSGNLSDVITEDGTGDFSEIGASLTYSGNVYSGTTLGESTSGFSSSNLLASNNGEILEISGAGSAGANMSSAPLTDGDVGTSVGACFLNASGGTNSECSDEPVTTDTLTASSLSNFDADGGSQTITVRSNIDWTVSESSSWISTNKTSGSNNETVIVTATVNTSTSSRTANVTISGGGITRTISVTQDGEEEIIIPGSCTEGANLAENKTIVDFSTEQNTDNGVANLIDGDETATNRWSAEFFPQYAVIDLGAENSVNGINIVPYLERAYQFTVEGSTSSTSGYAMLVDASDNTSGGSLINRTFTSTNVRYVKLTVTGASGYTGDWSSITEFEVLCAGETVTPELTVSSLNDFDANGGSQTISVNSNIDWTVSESSSWVSTNKTSGANNGTVIITTTANTSTASRTANVTISGGGITRTVSVTQDGEEVIVNPESCTAGTKIAENATIVDFSSEQNADNGVANIIDGVVSATNRWSAETFPQYAVIDLGAAYNVDEINLSPYADRAYQFTVEGSVSSATSGYNMLTDATGNTSGGSNINRTFTTQNVRYIKLTITGASGYTGSWSSVREFQVICAGETITPELTASSVGDFDADGGSQTISVSSNTDWTVSENSSWISTNKTSGANNGTVIITTTANTSSANRTANVTISAGGITQTVTITQDGKEEVVTTETCIGGINLAENAAIVDFSSEQNSDNGVANLVDGDDSNRWSAEFFPQNAVIDLGAVYEVDEINLIPYNDRAYQFLVEGSASSATSGFSTLTDATGNTTEASNINKTFDAQNVRYVKLTITGVTGSYTGDWSSIKEFEVLCAGEEVINNNLTVSSVSAFDADGESKSVSVSSNVSWSVSESSSWLSINTTNGSNNGSFTITASENSSTSERSANVTITGGDLSRSINVKQNGQEEVIISPESCTAGVNLALNGSIIDFSSEQDTDRGVANLIDGNDDNRWSGEFFPQYAVIDLGAVYEVEEINLVPYGSRAYQFTVEGSATTSNYSTLVDASGNTTEANSITKTFDAHNIRYVKLTITGVTGSYTGDWSSINEFKVICAGEVIVPDSLSVSSVSNFSANGNSQNVSVSSNVDWTVSENSSWVSITNGNGSDDGSFTINASENTSTSPRNATVTIAGGSVSQTISVSQLGVIAPSGDLDPTKAPSENFDLSQWYLSVPIDNGDGLATTIQVDVLNQGYELKNYNNRDYFYTGADGGMVFVNYPYNAPKTSTGTSYSRNELREMLTGGSGDTSNSTKDPGNNWYFSSSDNVPAGNEDSDDNAGGIDGVLTATLRVNHVTEFGSKDVQKGRIIIGQIHASKNEPCRLYYHKLPEHDKGAIYVAHEDFGGDETYYNIIGEYVDSEGDLLDDVSEPADGIELNEEFSYEIEVIGNKQWVTILRNGKPDATIPVDEDNPSEKPFIDMSDSDYENDWMYFKAGIYSQNNTTTNSSDYDQVTFYKLKQTHSAAPSNKNLTKVLIEDITVYPNPFTETINISLGEDSVAVKSIALVDGLGRLILTKGRNENENLIQLSGNFSVGIYYIQLLDIDGTVIAVRKAIRE